MPEPTDTVLDAATPAPEAEPAQTAPAETAATLDTAVGADRDDTARDEFGTRQRAPKGLRGSAIGTARWAWYTLTSMRTALILLFLLALASIPGSVLPQNGSDPSRVRQFLVDHPFEGRWLSRLGFFDVFASPWFAAIYLLLFISLAGCVLPRARRHLAAIGSKPPSAPRNLGRLPLADRWVTDLAPDVAVARANAFLRGRRFRTVAGSASVSAEKGYLRETGNLLFHLALLVLLGGVAYGSVFGYTGTVVVTEGQGFANTVAVYDSFAPGRLVHPSSLPPFSFTLDKFHASYVEDGPTRGSPKTFDAEITYRTAPEAATKPFDVRVNHPLSIDGVNMYLTGHGYAPHFVVRDGNGQVVLDESVPFLPRDGNFTSQGVVKVPEAKPDQLSFSGFFLPTAAFSQQLGPISVFPAADDPAVVLLAYTGDIGLSSGIPQSVYTLDTEHLTKVGTAALRVGQTMTLPDGQGSITFTGFDEFANFQMTHDPGKPVVLGAVVAIVLGLVLSLRVRRRRMWVRAGTSDGGRTVVEVGGLSRTDASGGFDEEFVVLTRRLRDTVPEQQVAEAANAGEPHSEGQREAEGVARRKED